MGLVIIFIGFIFICAFSIYYNDKMTKRQKENGILYSGFAKYLGGFQDLHGGEDIPAWIVFKKDNLTIGISKHEKEILIENIENIECSTKEAIEAGVSLGKLIVFGWYAFGLKKKTMTKCCIITFTDDFKKTRNVILAMNAEELVKEYLKLKSNSI